MDHSEFRQLVSDYAKLQQVDPRAFYRMRRIHIFLGYFVHLGIIGLNLTSIFALFYLLATGTMIGLLAYASGFIVLFSFALLLPLFLIRYNKFRFEILPSEAPELFRQIKNICQAFKIRPIDHVYGSHISRALAFTSYRFWPFGRRHNIVLGVLFLKSMTPEQAIAVVAHEIAHHANSDPTRSLSFWRIIKIWEVFRDINRKTIFTKPLHAFATWYVEKGDAFLWADSKVLELRADRLAAEVTSAVDQASALVRLMMNDLSQEEQIDAAKTRSWESGDPSQFSLMATLKELNKAPFPKGAAEKLAARLQLDSHVTDSHPSLNERLLNLGFELDPDNLASIEQIIDTWVKPFDKCAGEVLIPGKFQQMELEHDKLYRESFLQTFQNEAERRNIATAIINHGSEDPLALPKATQLLYGAEQAIPQFQDALTRYREHAGLHYELGRCYFALDDPRCVAHLEAAQKSKSWRYEALCCLANYYENIGDSSDLLLTRDALDIAYVESIQHDELVSEVTEQDTLSHVPYYEALGEPWLSLARTSKRLKRVYLAHRRPSVDRDIVQLGLFYVFETPKYLGDVNLFLGQQRDAVDRANGNPHDGTSWVFLETDPIGQWLLRFPNLIVWERT